MPYLILDPTEEYAAHQKRFLDRLGLEAVALFSSKGRHAQWAHVWKQRIGENVISEHVVDRDAIPELAEELIAAHPEGFFGLVPWDETHILLAAEIGEALELDWNPREVIERFRDKGLMKRHLRSHGGVRVNKAGIARNADEALSFQEEVGTWPIVVKPSGGAGSIQVSFALDPASLLNGCQQVLQGGLGEVLLEEFVGGEEYAVNGLVDHDGGVLVTDIWRYDKRDSHGERNLYYETIKLGTDETPFEAIAEYAAAVIDAMELRRSPFHMEVKVDDQGPCLIEVGARFAGGNQVGMASRLHHHSLFELAACHYLDDVKISPMDVDFAHYDAHAARILSGIQEEAIPRIEAVHGVDEVQALPSFAGFGILRKPGRPAPVSRDVTTKAWEVYLLHPDEEVLADDARTVRETLRYS